MTEEPPQPPKLTPEMLAQNDAEQAILKGKVSLPSSKGLLRAKAVINDWGEVPDLSPRQKQMLTEAYSQIGEFQKAFELSGDEVYLAIANAGADLCSCKDFETTALQDGRPTPVKYSVRFKLRNIVRDGRIVALMRCNSCGHLSCKK